MFTQSSMGYRPKKGGFTILRHNELPDNIGEMLQEVTSDVRIEPILQPLTGEEQSIGGNVLVKARADINTRVFWCRGQRAFFDVRIFDPNAQRHKNKTLKRCYESHEHEKKRDYNSRILNIGQVSFTPLDFSITGGNVVMYGIRYKMSYALLRSSSLCVRGSRKMSSEYAQLNSDI